MQSQFAKTTQEWIAPKCVPSHFTSTISEKKADDLGEKHHFHFISCKSTPKEL